MRERKVNPFLKRNIDCASAEDNRNPQRMKVAKSDDGFLKKSGCAFKGWIGEHPKIEIDCQRGELFKPKDKRR